MPRVPWHTESILRVATGGVSVSWADSNLQVRSPPQGHPLPTNDVKPRLPWKDESGLEKANAMKSQSRGQLARATADFGISVYSLSSGNWHSPYVTATAADSFLWQRIHFTWIRNTKLTSTWSRTRNLVSMVIWYYRSTEIECEFGCC